MLYVSIDCETTGLDWRHCEIIEFAAVIADTVTGKVIDTFERILVDIDEEELFWEDIAKTMNYSWYQDAVNAGVNVCTFDDLLSQFRDRLIENNVDPMKITAAGKNFATFDLKFIELLPGYGEVCKFRHRCIDPAMLYFHPGDDVLPDSKICLVRAKNGMHLSPELEADLAKLTTVKHRALADAKMVVDLLNRAWRCTP